MPPSKNRRSSGTPVDLKSYIRQSGSYHAQNENRVIHDVQECARSFPSLHPILDYFTATDGKVQRLLALRGTIPISYKGSVYKIPVHLWVMPYHPAGPPLVFVVPTKTMVFRQQHPHVDSNNGLVYMPYLSSWDALTSTISGTVNSMIQVFCIKPPVYSRETPAPVLEDDVERRRLVKEVSERLEAELSRNTVEGRRIVQRLLVKQQSMRQEENVRQTRKRQIARERSELVAAEHYMRHRIRELRRWHIQHPQPPPGAAIDDITRPRTVLREQMIGYSAHDAAQTDALDQIDEAFATGAIGNEGYLRDVRKVARQQFFSRAMQRRVKQEIAATEKPEELARVVPTQQPTRVQSSTHQRRTPVVPVHPHTAYRPQPSR